MCVSVTGFRQRSDQISSSGRPPCLQEGEGRIRTIRTIRTRVESGRLGGCPTVTEGLSPAGAVGVAGREGGSVVTCQGGETHRMGDGLVVGDEGGLGNGPSPLLECLAGCWCLCSAVNVGKEGGLFRGRY